MNEIYEAIEQKIKSNGYPGVVDGYDIYNEICDFIEEKENGTFIFLSKKGDDIIFEYQVDIMDDNFNLSYINIKSQGQEFHIDFDHD